MSQAFMKIEGIPGQATDKDHENWILIEALDAPIVRRIREGARDVERTQGTTTLGDITVHRLVDKSSVKLAEACAKGEFKKEVTVHICAEINKVRRPRLKFKLKNVIVTNYGVNFGGDDLSETVAFNFEEVEWIYTVLDPKTGEPKGDIIGRYNPGEGGGL